MKESDFTKIEGHDKEGLEILNVLEQNSNMVFMLSGISPFYTTCRVSDGRLAIKVNRFVYACPCDFVYIGNLYIIKNDDDTYDCFVFDTNEAYENKDKNGVNLYEPKEYEDGNLRKFKTNIPHAEADKVLYNFSMELEKEMNPNPDALYCSYEDACEIKIMMD